MLPSQRLLFTLARKEILNDQDNSYFHSRRAKRSLQDVPRDSHSATDEVLSYIINKSETLLLGQTRSCVVQKYAENSVAVSIE